METAPRHGQSWFVFGLAAVGAATGYLLALSRSPVVAIVLPLLFGLVGGAGGIYIAKADLSSAHGRDRLALIGKSAASLSISMVIVSALVLGWLGRATETTQLKLSALPGFQQLNARQATALINLRMQLQSLGASTDEQKEILSRAIALDSRAVIATKLSAIAAQMAETLQAFNTPQTAAQQKTVDTGGPLTELKALLTATRPLIQQWATDAAGGKDVPTAAVADQLNSLQIEATNLMTSRSELAATPALAQSIISLKSTLTANQLVLAPESVAVSADQLQHLALPRQDNSPRFATTISNPIADLWH